MGADHVLGAVVVAAIMLSGVAFVVTHEPNRPSPEQAVERQLEQNAQDFLYVYKDWSLDEPCLGATMLERFIIDGTNRDHAEWERRTRKFFPLGTDTSLLLSNGHALYPLHEKFKISGATNDVAIQPDWSYTLPIHQTDTADGASRALLDVPSIFYSDITAPHGEAIRTTITFTSVDGGHLRTGWGLAALTDLAGNGLTMAGPGWRLEEKDQDRLKVDLNPVDLLTSQDLRLVVRDLTAENATSLSVLIRLPHEWTLTSARSLSLNWTKAEDHSNESGDSVRFTLNGSLVPGEQEFIIRAKPPASPTRPFDVITAQFSNGSLAQSSLVVTYPVQAERSLPRAAYLTMPYPLQVGGTGLFGVAFANGGPEITVNRIDFEIPGGYDIPKNDGRGARLFGEFGDAISGLETLSNESERGSWTHVDGRHVRWTGERTIARGSAGEWLVELPITSDATQVTSVERSGSGPELEVSFGGNGFSARSTTWGASPGVVRVRVPADDPTTNDSAEGYPSEQGEHGYAAHLRDDGVRLSASGSLAVELVEGGDAVNMEHALANSSFTVDRRLVPVGGLLSATFRGESLVTDLAAAGGTVAKLAVKLYAPPSLGCRPTAVWERDAGALPLAAVHDARATRFDGVDAVFFVGDDKNVHRLTSEGVPVWVNRLSSNSVVLETATFGLADHAVFVGTADGILYRLDPLTGVQEQRAVIARPSLSGGTSMPHAVTSLWVDESRELVVVGTSLGVVEVRQASDFGDPLRVLTGERVLQVRAVEDGDVLVLTEKRMLRYDSSLVLEASMEVSAPKGFATPSAASILVAGDESTLVLDARSFATIGLGSIPHHGTAAMAAAGDATGDGVEDLVVALDDAALRVVDGAGLKLVWNQAPVIADLDEPLPLQVFSSAATLGGTCPGVPAIERGYRLETDCSTPIYGGESRCTWMLPDAPDADAERHLPSPLGLDVRGGRVAYSAWNGRESVVRVFDAEGNKLSSTTSEPGVRTVSVDIGNWLLSEKLVTGTDQGTLVVADLDSQAETYRTAATEFVGLFTFTMAVPQGGFYGAHLLVAELTWKTAEGEERHARLLDWFNVGDKQGKAVAKPTYRLVMVVDQPEIR